MKSKIKDLFWFSGSNYAYHTDAGLTGFSWFVIFITCVIVFLILVGVVA